MAVEAATPPPGPKMESLAHIDMRSLSQTELHSLSLCSSSSFDLNCTSDVVTPNIDRSSFNESAGGRRQTISRHRRRGRPGRPPKPLSSSDPHVTENKTIINFLKHLIGENPSPNAVANYSNQVVVYDHAMAVNTGGSAQFLGNLENFGDRKRKRGRKPKEKVVESGIGLGVELERVNRNGVDVDIGALENADEIYGAELSRRTAGLESEERALGFMDGLGGQWCSRRKKRKIVDACLFGDALPVGWKLVLALRRRGFRVTIYCRRYMSPSGEQFQSCKEVAYYLNSHFGFKDSKLPMDQSIDRIQHANPVDSWNHGGLVDNGSGIKRNLIPSSALPSSSILHLHPSEASLTGIENLPDVQVEDIFECYKCNMIFRDKEKYMHHLLSFHQRTTRTFRLGTAVAKGVIIKDGKYECQFCHKVFLERRRYNGHVGNHVKSYVRNCEKSPKEAQAHFALLSRAPEMDALTKIAQSSVKESEAANIEKSCGVPSSDLPNAKATASRNEERVPANIEKIRGVSSSDLSNVKETFSKYDERVLDQELSQHGGKQMKVNESSEKIVVNKSLASTTISEQPKLERRDVGLSGLVLHGNFNLEKSNYQTEMSNVVPHYIEEDTFQNRDAEQSSSSLPAVETVAAVQKAEICNTHQTIEKGDVEYCDAHQTIDYVTGFEDMRLEEIETLRLSLVNQQTATSLPGTSKDFSKNVTIMEEGFTSFAKLDSNSAMLGAAREQQVSTACIWCGTEFYHEAVDVGTPSDSIAFMCPSCKAKISGHLDCGLSLNSHHF